MVSKNLIILFLPDFFYRSIFSAAARQKMEMVKKIWGVKKIRGVKKVIPPPISNEDMSADHDYFYVRPYRYIH